MRKILISACLAVIILAPFLGSGALSSPNLDMNQKSGFAEAGSIALSYAPSITVMAADLGKAASGNSNPVNITVNVTELSSNSSISEAVCGLDRFNFEIDTLEVPPDGKALRIMMVNQENPNFMYAPAPCSYRTSIVPISDYLDQGSPNKPSPSRQNVWANGLYTFRLRYLNDGSETISDAFSFKIGPDGSLSQASRSSKIAVANPKLPVRDSGNIIHLDPINQLNPQPEPPMPVKPSNSIF
jgi:hypothetical protein